MARKHVKTAIVLGAVALAGCQRNGVDRRSAEMIPRPATAGQAHLADDARPPRTATVSLTSRPARGTIRQVVAEEKDGVEPGGEADTATPLPAAGPDTSALGLDGAIETALVQNPDLVALRESEGVSAAAFGVAQTYPINPWVQVQATPIQQNTEGGSGSLYHYVLVMQTLQLAHQQQFREEMASSQLNQVRWTVHNAELLNVAQTARLYWVALYQRGIRDLTRAGADQNQELLRITEKQLAAGQISSADAAIVRIDARSTRQQAELAEANYQTALLDLRRQLNVPLDRPLNLTGDLAAMRWKSAREAALAEIGSADEGLTLKLGGAGDADAGGDDLFRGLAASRPDVMAARADIGTAHANLKLANAARTPDLQIGPYYQHDDFGTYFYGFRFQVDMPVINNGMPLVRQRAAEHQQRETTSTQLQARAEMEALAAVDRYERARRLAEAAGAAVAEDLPAELQKLEQQFQENEVDVLRVFQARTSLLQNRRAYLDTLNELAQATAAVTAFTGIPPTALVSPAPPEP